jgi:hypothetical protein
MDAPAATISVFQDRPWVGNPRLGAFVVVLDGHRVGTVAIHDNLVISVSPGEHAVRIRQWWFRSSPLTVKVEQSSVLHLRADIPRSLGLFARFARFLFSPSTALVLDQIE